MREHAAGIGVRFVGGEPSDDEVLRAAGIMRARGVIACVDSDADNIFVTLTVRAPAPRHRRRGARGGDVRGAIIVGVRDPSGQFQPQPPAETLLRAGDAVTALGTERTMERLEELFAAAATQTRS